MTYSYFRWQSNSEWNVIKYRSALCSIYQCFRVSSVSKRILIIFIFRNINEKTSFCIRYPAPFTSNTYINFFIFIILISIRLNYILHLYIFSNVGIINHKNHMWYEYIWCVNVWVSVMYWAWGRGFAKPKWLCESVIPAGNLNRFSRWMKRHRTFMRHTSTRLW